MFDAFLEIFLVRTQLYIYSHVIPWGSYAAGEWYQFPLIWESVLVSTVMIPAGVLLYKRRHRPDAGREAGPEGPLPSAAVPRSAPSS